MKKTTIFKVLGLLLLIIVASCSKEEFDSSNGKSNLKTLVTTPTDCQDFSLQLIAGQNINVGMVSFTWDENKPTICFNTENGWMIQEVHFYIGDFANVPRNPQGVPVPGHFPYYATGLNTSSYCYPREISLQNVPDCPVILVHVVVINGLRNETAWAQGCKSFQEAFGIKRWGYLDDCHCFCKNYLTLKAFYHPAGANSTTWTCLSYGTHLFSGVEWCSNLGLVEPVDGVSYPLKVNGVDIGTATLAIIGGKIFVTLTASDVNSHFESTHVFYGSQQALLNNYGPGYCPNFLSFPYSNTTPGSTQVVEIPL